MKVQWNRLMAMCAFALVTSTLAAADMPRSEWLGKIGDCAQNAATMQETMSNVSASDQVALVAEVNKALTGMKGSNEERAAAFVKANVSALTAAMLQNKEKRMGNQVLAEIYATVPPEYLTVVSEQLAKTVLKRGTLSKEVFITISTNVLHTVTERLGNGENAGVREAFAAVTFLKALGEPASKDLINTMLSQMGDPKTRETAVSEWIGPALGINGNAQSYDPMLGAANAGDEPDHTIVESLLARDGFGTGNGGSGNDGNGPANGGTNNNNPANTNNNGGNNNGTDGKTGDGKTGDGTNGGNGTNGGTGNGANGGTGNGANGGNGTGANGGTGAGAGTGANGGTGAGTGANGGTGAGTGANGGTGAGAGANGGTGAGAGTGANGGTGAGAGTGANGGTGAGTGANGGTGAGAGTGAGTGAGGAGAGAGTGAGGGSGNVPFPVTVSPTGPADITVALLGDLGAMGSGMDTPINQIGGGAGLPDDLPSGIGINSNPRPYVNNPDAVGGNSEGRNSDGDGDGDNPYYKRDRGDNAGGGNGGNEEHHGSRPYVGQQLKAW